MQGTYIALARLRKKGIQIISSMDFARPDNNVNNSFGLFSLNDEGKKNLAMPIWHWGIYYEKLIRSILNKTLQQEYEASNKALNYYWGMSAGVVEFICSKNLPESVRRLAELLKENIVNNVYSPFKGPFVTKDGNVIDKEGKGLTFEEIITMNWLMENVEGVIPVYEQLSEDGKATVESAGAPVTGVEGK